MRSAAPHAVLATWFVLASGTIALQAWVDGWVGVDAQIYYRGSTAWLAGDNPWEAVASLRGAPLHFSALPTVVVLLAPLTLVPEVAFSVAAVAISGFAAVYVVRVLALPPYFLLFPPLVQGVVSGNPNVILFALLLCGRPVLESLAPLLKVYAVIPLVGRGRWRSLGWFVVFGLLTLLAMPLWQAYLLDFDVRNARLLEEADGGTSAARFGLLMVVASALGLFALWLRDRDAAAWLAVPAVWPASQFHYSIFGMPMMKGRPWLAGLLAIPLPLIPAVIPVLLALEMFVHTSMRAGVDDRQGKPP